MVELLSPPRVLGIRLRHANHLINYKSRQQNYARATELISQLERKLCRYTYEIEPIQAKQLETRTAKLHQIIRKGEEQIVPNYLRQREEWHKKVTVLRDRAFDATDRVIQNALLSDLRRLQSEYKASDRKYSEAQAKLWAYRKELREKQRIAFKVQQAQWYAKQLDESEKRLYGYLQDIIKIRQEMMQEQSKADQSLADQDENIRRCQAAIDRHKEAVKKLYKEWNRRKSDIRIKLDLGTEIITMACEDLSFYRKVEVLINVAALVAGLLKAIAGQIFKEGLKQILRWGGIQITKSVGWLLTQIVLTEIYDAQANPVWFDTIQGKHVYLVLNSMAWKDKIEAEAFLEAETVKIGGFTEVGSKLFGKQYDTLKMGYAELFAASMEGGLWNEAIILERKVITAGEKLLKQMRRRRTLAEVEYQTIARINAVIVKDQP